VNTAAVEHPVRARLGSWPYEPDVAHLVLLDHHMIPGTADVARWIVEARATGARALRTGALFAASTPAFHEAGFQAIDRLRLLELDLSAQPPAVPPRGGAPARLKRLRPSMLAEASRVDRRAFGAPWANDAAALGDIMSATPHHRSRCVQLDGRMVAFAISGRANAGGYIQRLAVDPSAQRAGLGRALVDDAVHWMRRRHVAQVLVNTASDNVAALSLYHSYGFDDRPDDLSILERSLRS
jgi:ribosomal-protein-alanine N-acetyltransferase